MNPNESSGIPFVSMASASAPAPAPKPAEPSTGLFSVGDGVKLVGRSVTTIKQMLRELHVEPLKTAGGQWILNGTMIERLRGEVERRKMEVLRR